MIRYIVGSTNAIRALPECNMGNMENVQTKTHYCATSKEHCQPPKVAFCASKPHFRGSYSPVRSVLRSRVSGMNQAEGPHHCDPLRPKPQNVRLPM